MRRIFGVVLALVLIAGACGGDDDDQAADASASPAAGEEPLADESQSTSGDTATDSADTTGDDGDGDDAGSATSAGGGDICGLAADLAADDPFSDVSVFDGEQFFEVMDDAWDRVEAIAPDEIEADVEIVREYFDQMEQAVADADYNFVDPGLAEALEDLDTERLEEASDRISDFFGERCGIDIDTAPDTGAGSDGSPLLDPDDLADIDPEAGEAEILAQLFGIDAELAQCIIDELGAIDPDNIDPSMMTREVCGTTMLEVFSGTAG